MPRRIPTIDDFKFSLDKTIKVNTNCRMKNCQLNIVSIHFTKSYKKTLKQFILHTENEEIMWVFIDKLNDILMTMELPLIDKTKLKLKKNVKIEESYTDDCFWYNMPDFKANENIYDCVKVQLEVETVDCPKYRKFIRAFYDTFNIILWPKITAFWYPERPTDKLSTIQNKMYISEQPIVNKYPIYIISKGRYEKRYTSKYLEWSNIDYKIVIEPDEFLNYSKYIDKDKILVLPNEYLHLNQGSIPARNFVWEHSKNNGHKRHWILDDNITSYKRFINSQKVLVKGAVVFRVVEDYVDRFTNVKIAGHNYTMFGVSTNTTMKPITMNTRIYSSILLSNDIYPDYKWRGKYNEDTDLSLRILKAGYPTVLFNCFLADKLKTLTQKGGNTDTVYAEKDGILLKADSLVKQHGDVAKIIYRFGRPHHYVNYSSFKHLQPLYMEGTQNSCDNLVNEYGMELVQKDTSCLYTIDPVEDAGGDAVEDAVGGSVRGSVEDTIRDAGGGSVEDIQSILSEIAIVKNRLTLIEKICNKVLSSIGID